MRRALLALVAAVGALALTVPAGAVVGGELDGDGHPNVGMVRFTAGGSRFRCSGTLIAPDVVLTAAHCTEGATNVMVSFDTVATADPLASTNPGDPSRWITGTAHAHPDFNHKLQSKNLLDIGVVVLDAPASSKWPGIASSPLPAEGALDDLLAAGELRGAEFEVVGYGVFFEHPDDGPRKPTAVRDLTRRVTTAPLMTLQPEVVMLAENEHDSRFGGGTCFGDSGGPLFLDGVVVGDTSWGSSQFCSGGAAGYQRTDTPGARDFLAQFVTLP